VESISHSYQTLPNKSQKISIYFHYSSGCLIETGEDSSVALRGTFIIDPKGVVRVAQYNDLPIGRSIDEVLRLVDALQFHE
jgi:alkyl hydroperoxide reductase subunit AhpC